jgi:hypothetical protein
VGRILEKKEILTNSHFADYSIVELASGSGLPALVNALWGACIEHNKEKLAQQLNSKKEECHNLLSEADAIRVLHGARKLERLLVEAEGRVVEGGYNTSLYLAVHSFKDHYRRESNPFINFVLQEIQGVLALEDEVVINPGTAEERQLIEKLRYECQKYQKYLEPGIIDNSSLVLDKKTLEYRTPDDIKLGTALELKIDKYNIIQGFLNVLNDKRKAAPEKIIAFKKDFADYKNELHRHRDKEWKVWATKIAVILSSICFGVGLAYSHQKTGSCFGLFKARGGVVADRLAQQLQVFEDAANKRSIGGQPS